ncbi:MAG: hypothetical protein M1536_03540 [Firmicutes bacterium]|nr:hypothetical protein [Bacillota bacterium]
MRRIKTAFLLILVVSFLFCFSSNALDKPRAFPEKHASDFSRVYWIADMGGDFGTRICFAVWSNDSGYIIFNKKETSDPEEPAEKMRLWIVNVKNHKANVISNSRGWGIVNRPWSTNSKYVIFVKDGSIYVATNEGGTAKKIFGREDSFIATPYLVCWIPNSSKVSYVKIKNDGYYLCAVNVENGKKEELFRLGDRKFAVRFIAWFAKGKKFAYQMTYEPKDFSSWKSYLYLTDKKGKNKIFITPERFHTDMEWDKDAGSVVYSVWRTSPASGKGRRDIYIYNIKSGVEKRLTTSGDNYSPEFSYDKKYIIYFHAGEKQIIPNGRLPFRELKSVEIATGKTFSISDGLGAVLGAIALRKNIVVYARVITKEKKGTTEYICFMMMNRIRGKNNHKIFPGQKLTINMMTNNSDRTKFGFHYDGQLWGVDLK